MNCTLLFWYPLMLMEIQIHDIKPRIYMFGLRNIKLFSFQLLLSAQVPATIAKQVFALFGVQAQEWAAQLIPGPNVLIFSIQQILL